jgi:hypothetical protein
MSILAAAAAAMLGDSLPATPSAAHLLVQPAAVSSYTLTAGRLWSLVAALLGLVGVVIGGLALARSAGGIDTGMGRGRAIVALLVGLIGMVLSGLHLANSTGGIGTGSGRLGAIVALVVGLIGMVLGGLALARSRRTN